jgi:hypothetical protein
MATIKLRNMETRVYPPVPLVGGTPPLVPPESDAPRSSGNFFCVVLFLCGFVLDCWLLANRADWQSPLAPILVGAWTLACVVATLRAWLRSR